MTPPVRIDIDRVLVSGAAVECLDAAQVRALVGRAVAAALTPEDLPRGRSARVAVQVAAGPLGTSAESVSRAVGSGIVTAIRQTSGRGGAGSP